MLNLSFYVFRLQKYNLKCYVKLIIINSVKQSIIFVCIYDNDLLNLYHKKGKSVTLHPYTLQPRKGRGAEAEAPNIANIFYSF